MEHGQRLDGHAGAHAPRMNQSALGVVVAQQERADEVARPFGIGPSDDDELRAVEALALDPRAPISRQIRPVSPLGDDALEPMPTRRPSERLAVAAFVLALDDPRRRCWSNCANRSFRGSRSISAHARQTPR